MTASGRPVTALAPLADPCPRCHPGDHDAVAPFLVARDGDCLHAWYKHGPCRSFWSAWWPLESAGWPLRREGAPQPESLEQQMAKLIGLLASLFDEAEEQPEAA